METTESASFFYRHRHRSARSARRGRARSPRREWNGSRPQSALHIALSAAESAMVSAPVSSSRGVSPIQTATRHLHAAPHIQQSADRAHCAAPRIAEALQRGPWSTHTHQKKLKKNTKTVTKSNVVRTAPTADPTLDPTAQHSQTLFFIGADQSLIVRHSASHCASLRAFTLLVRTGCMA